MRKKKAEIEFKALSFRIPKPLWIFMRKSAVERGTSVNQYVTDILTHLQTEKEKTQKNEFKAFDTLSI